MQSIIPAGPSPEGDTSSHNDPCNRSRARRTGGLDPDY